MRSLPSLLCVVLCVAFAGCRKNIGTRHATSGPVYGGSLLYATDREPTCLDPHVHGDMPQVFVAEQFLDSLVSMDRDGHIGPWLATSWDISPDGKTYTFKLRRDVVFTDGTKFTAAAVKANLDHMTNPATQSSTAGGYIRQYVRTDIVDDYTAAVHLSTPYAAFLEVLAQGFLGIESPAALRQSREQNCQSPVGSGPFKIVAWDHQNEVVLERNPNYNSAPPTAHHQGPAYLDRIEWKIIPEPSIRFASLQAGELDVIASLSPETEAAASKNPELSLIVADRPGNPTFGGFNTRRAPFSGRNVREAFVRSADVQGALDSVYFHEYQRAGGPLSPATPFYSPDFQHAKDYDPVKAERLLDAAGWTARDAQGYRIKSGNRLTVHVLAYALSAAEMTLWEQVQATTRQVGFDMLIDPITDGDLYQREGTWDYDVIIGYWNTNTPDVLRIVFGSEFIEPVGKGGWHQNSSGFSDPHFDRIVEQALETQDSARRRALYYEAQRIVSGQYLELTTYPQTTRLAVYKTAHGVRLEPSLTVTSLYDAWVTK